MSYKLLSHKLSYITKTEKIIENLSSLKETGGEMLRRNWEWEKKVGKKKLENWEKKTIGEMLKKSRRNGSRISQYLWKEEWSI